jgi:hypothetical protein
MFGDQYVAVIRGPVTVTTPGGQVVTLSPGQTIPSTLLVQGAIFNVPLTNGVTGAVIPAGTPLTATAASNLRESTRTVLPAVSTGALPLLARGAFKIADNESPRPQDRVFLTYNFYNNVDASLNPPGFPQTNVHREGIGFEKTFLGGNASIGMRLPFAEDQGDSSVSRSGVGDLSIILKYAFINNRETGNVISAGLVVTVPTGANFLPEGVPDINPTLLQPFVGAIYNIGDFYLQGFSSIVVPTDSQDVTLWLNDIAVGWFLYRSRDCDRLVTAIVPTLEAHITTPLNHRNALTDPIPGIDIVDLTGGVTVGLGSRSTLGLGVVTPLTGPKPFDVEAQAYFNFRF